MGKPSLIRKPNPTGAKAWLDTRLAKIARRSRKPLLFEKKRPVRTTREHRERAIKLAAAEKAAREKQNKTQ
ncbi:hypothetical protein KKE06_04025 [Candidatus Micrarchaeota archaeon]|nr:hypothetical protein [Candidatus Micrarchaeota archaeon]MBU1930967.1 hypothetical protein [Candidatus Micrarchaeota archaeon]